MKKSVSMLCHPELPCIIQNYPVSSCIILRHTELPLRHPEFISGSISYMQKKEMLNQVQHDGFQFGMTVAFWDDRIN